MDHTVPPNILYIYIYIYIYIYELILFLFSVVRIRVVYTLLVSDPQYVPN